MGEERVFFGVSGCVIEDVSVKRFPSYADLTYSYDCLNSRLSVLLLWYIYRAGQGYLY